MWGSRNARRRHSASGQLGEPIPLEQRVLLSAGHHSGKTVEAADQPNLAAPMVVDVSGRWNQGDTYLDITKQRGFKLKGFFTILGEDSQYRIHGSAEVIGSRVYLDFRGKGHYLANQNAKITISSHVDINPSGSFGLLTVDLRTTIPKTGTVINQNFYLTRI